MKKSVKSIFILLLLAMLLPSISFASGEEFDYSKHWAKDEIQYLMDKKIVSGYKDGNFKPDQSITRAEFIKIINSVFTYSELGQAEFEDISKDDWFFEEIKKAIGANYIAGYEDGTIKPNKAITRQEASKIMGTVFSLDETKSKSANDFEDKSKIGGWAKGYISILRDKAYISGYPDNTFRPNNPITRAEAVKIIANASGEIINRAGKHRGDRENNLLVNTPDVVLEDMHIKGDLYLAEGIGEGDVRLDNVRVDGETYIRAGGENSITIVKSIIGPATVKKEYGNVRLVLAEATDVFDLVINKNTILEIEKDARVSSLKVKGKSDIKVKKGGSLGRIKVEAKGVEMKVEGSIDSLISTEDLIINGEIIKKGKEILVKNGKIEEIQAPSEEEILESEFVFEKSTGTIIKYMGLRKEVDIPAKIKGVEVQVIGDAAFANKGLRSISIPNSVKTINQFAFANNELRSINIPDSVTTIEVRAFNNNQLSDEQAFIYARKENGNEDTSKIVSYAGARRSNVEIPSSVKTIADLVFYEIELESISIPNSVTTIGDLAFTWNQLGSINIPNSVTTIGEGAFANNQLRSLSLANSVTSIGESAFFNNQLRSINIPSSVTTIGAEAFNKNQLSDEQAFIYRRKENGSEDTSTIVSYAGARRSNVEIPSSVKTIGKGTFTMTELESVTIANSVTSIGELAFAHNKLKSINIPDSVRSIGDFAFGYNKLKSVEIPSSVRSMGKYTFKNNGVNFDSGDISATDFVGSWEIKENDIDWTKKTK